MTPSLIEILGTVVFALAVLHTFSVKFFQHVAHSAPKGSVKEMLFHLLGEVEIVFGAWAALLLALIAFVASPHTAVEIAESRNYTEPLFVFAIMTVAASGPVVGAATWAIAFVSRLLPFPRWLSFYLALLTVGPLLGSLITEPAAMTVTALILRDRYFSKGGGDRFKYLTLGTLFVNVSIGGVLTSFAAPPVLMVARTWDWDQSFMLTHFAWKAVLACVANAGAAALLLQKDLKKTFSTDSSTADRSPLVLKILQLGILALIVLSAHHAAIFIGLLLLFLGLVEVTRKYQSELKLKESLLVAAFLGGLVVLGGFQTWWLKPLFEGIGSLQLYFGAAFLTAFTDNAALTYLGSQTPGLADDLKYALVAGAVVGGGLTVIANAPNPAGYSILKDRFGADGISAARLAWGAALPTAIALALFALSY